MIHCDGAGVRLHITTHHEDGCVAGPQRTVLSVLIQLIIFPLIQIQRHTILVALGYRCICLYFTAVSKILVVT